LHAGGQRFDPAWLHHLLLLNQKLRHEHLVRMLMSNLGLDRSLKIRVCDRKIDWTALSLVFVQAKVEFVKCKLSANVVFTV
jgi:hypothetical protein